MCPRLELHLFGLLGHIHHSTLICLATVGLGTGRITHNAPAAKDWQKECGKSDGVWSLITHKNRHKQSGSNETQQPPSQIIHVFVENMF